jgi:hypothetical protein
MPVKMIAEIRGSGLSESTNKTIAILDFQGRRVRLAIELLVLPLKTRFGLPGIC